MIVTGFGPFGPAGTAAHESNPSQLIIERLTDLDVETFTLPVSYHAVSEFPGILPTDEPILSIGVAGDRTEAKLEKVAINWAQATIADNDGYVAPGVKLDLEGPDGIFSGLEVEGLAESVGIGVSYSAGTYVCNALSYALYRQRPLSVFLHIPPVEYLSLDDGTDLVRRIVECLTSPSLAP